MNTNKTPALSVVIVTDRFSTIDGVMDAFAAQTARAEVEMIIVLPEANAGGFDSAGSSRFASVRIVAVPSIEPMPAARAAGVRAATAPVIFIGETHSFPHPDFAAAVIGAHEGPWDVVIPGIGNANPESARSWASFLLDYGYWLEGLPAGRVPNSPTWNASYKRRALLELDGLLDGALSSGDELPAALRGRGSSFYFHPDARIGHVNLEARGWLDERFLSGLVVGANRARRWSLPRRLAYFMASPLIPFVLLYRNVPSLRQLYGIRALPSWSGPVLFAAAFIRSAGEAFGYLRGLPPEAASRMEDYELRKMSYVTSPTLIPR